MTDIYHPRSQWKNRISRARTENMKIINIYTDKFPNMFTLFSVTGRIYQISFTESMNCSCSCPYFIQHNNELCKHILFLLIKFFSIPIDDTEKDTVEYSQNPQLLLGLIDQFELTKNYLFVSDKIREKYQMLLDRQHKKGLIPNIRSNDTCVICFGELTKEKTNLACPTCKNVLHKDCIKQWFTQQDSCPYCRSLWVDDDVDDSEEIMGIQYLKIT